MLLQGLIDVPDSDSAGKWCGCLFGGLRVLGLGGTAISWWWLCRFRFCLLHCCCCRMHLTVLTFLGALFLFLLPAATQHIKRENEKAIEGERERKVIRLKLPKTMQSFRPPGNALGPLIDVSAFSILILVRLSLCFCFLSWFSVQFSFLFLPPGGVAASVLSTNWRSIFIIISSSEFQSLIEKDYCENCCIHSV